MKYIKQPFLFTALSFFLVAGVSIASSWVGPTAEPPNNNVSAPINVSSVSQTKTGALSVGGFSLVDGTQGAGKFLVSDALGKASWVNAGGGGSVGGSGTVNYVSRWTSGSSLGNSQIFDDGSYVGIGTNAPTAKLHLKAGDKKNNPWAFRLEQGQIASGNVLTSDASGNAYWAPPSVSKAAGLSLVVNAGTANCGAKGVTNTVSLGRNHLCYIQAVDSNYQGSGDSWRGVYPTDNPDASGKRNWDAGITCYGDSGSITAICVNF